MDGIHQGQFVSQVRVSGVSTYGVATPRPLNASLPFRCTLKGTRDTLLKNHPYAVGETMQRRSEGSTWVRSTRGQFKSTRGSRRGHRSAPLSRLGRRGAHACTRIFPSSTPWAWVETTRVWDGCMGHLAPLGERQARCTSAHTPPLGARIQTTRAPVEHLKLVPMSGETTLHAGNNILPGSPSWSIRSNSKRTSAYTKSFLIPDPSSSQSQGFPVCSRQSSSSVSEATCHCQRLIKNPCISATMLVN